MSIALGTNQNVLFTASPVTISAEPSGNVLIFFIAAFRSAAARTVSSLSTTNVTWTKLAGTTNGSMDSEIWFGIVAGGSSGTSVTITMSGTGSTFAGNITGFSGTVASSLNDGTGVTQTGTSTGPSTAAFSATLANDLVLTCEGHANGTAPTVQPGGSWSNLTFSANSTTVGVQGNYILHGAVGSQSATWTIGNLAWVSALGALKVLPKTSTLTATMASFSGSLAKQGRIPLTATLAAFAGTLIKQAQKVFSAS